MRRRISSFRLPRSVGAYYRSFATQPVTPAKFSLSVSPRTPKDNVLGAIEKHVKGRFPGSQSSSGHRAAILASQDFAAWLEDSSFMGSLLQTLHGSSSGSDAPSHIDILAGVVDGITTPLPFSDPQRGFSILYGSAGDILPDLWDESSFSPNIEPEKGAYISFLSNPLAGDCRPLDITLPLASTIFQNGRRSTLFASRWRKGPGEALRHELTSHKQMQRVAPHGSTVGHTTPSIPLIPLTAPRKITAGLGNILRQVEIDGAATPASKELEMLIPQVFEARSKRHGSSSAGPIGVWAWVIPPHVVEAEQLQDLQVFQADNASLSESELAAKSVDVFSRLTSSCCRLHRILSGGGGWGPKQGLLSLDPETSYIQPEEDSIEMFIKSLQGGDSASEGLVTPGSYVLFCIEPHAAEEKRQGRKPSPTISLGVAPASDEGVRLYDTEEEVKIYDDHFGAASSAGLFLRTIPETNGSSSAEGAEKPPQPYTTKISVPRAYLSMGLA